MKAQLQSLFFALALLSGVHELAVQGAVFPIATNGVASQAGIFAAFGGSNYLVGLQGDGTTNDTAICAQLVSTNGAVVGARILTGRTGGIPFVASGGTNFLLCWSDNRLAAGGGNDQVYGQFVSGSGTLVGSPFTFGPTNEEQNMEAGGGSLLAFDGRNYLAVWDTGAFHDASSGDVHGALFNQSGALVAPVISITSGAAAALAPAVTFGKTNYLVVWNNQRSDGSGLFDVYGEFISTNGAPGPAFAISQTPTPSYNPGCVAFDGSDFMVVWNKDVGPGYPNPAIWNLYGRLVSPAGTFPGNEVAMVTRTNSPVHPALASDGANYLLAWGEGLPAGNPQMLFQMFDPVASPMSAAFHLFEPQGTNAPLFAAVLFDGSRFEITAVLGGVAGLGPSGAGFTSTTGTWGTFQSSTLTVSGPLTVAFTANPTNGVVPLTVNFAGAGDDSAGNAISQWNWSFGDGSTGTAQNPSHTYRTPGVFSPTLTVTNNLGLAITNAHSDLITAYPAAPVYSGLVLNGGFETGDFTGWFPFGAASQPLVDDGSQTGIAPYSGTYEAALGTSGTPGHLAQTLSTVPGASYLLSLWLANPQADPGEFIVSWNGNPLLDTTNVDLNWTRLQFVVPATGTSTVLQFGFQDDYNNLALDAVDVESRFLQFGATPATGTAPLTVQFAAAAADNQGTPIASWSWNFGDGSVGSGQNLSHTYAVPGFYFPSLLATNHLAGRISGTGPSIEAYFATGLVLNGSFETGDFTHWTSGGNFSFCSVANSAAYAHSGHYGADLGPFGSLGHLSQTLPTTAGMSYVLSLWLDSPDGQTNNEFLVTWNGYPLFDEVDMPAIGWTNLQFLVSATGTNSVLEFGFRDDPSALGLDDIRVVPTPPDLAGVSLAGANLVLHGVNGQSGATSFVLMSTNLTLPSSQWTRFATNVLSASGNFTITLTNTVTRGVPRRFYRLETP